MSKKTPKEALPRLAAYYDCSRSCYWILDRSGNWITVNGSSLRRHLKASGLSPDCVRDELLSEVDQALNNYEMECAIAYAGPLAGHPKGITEQCGNRILVTSGPTLIESQGGDFPLIAKLLENLFADPIADQRVYVLGWLKVGYEALRMGARRPGQVMAFAGPRNGGKSLFQNIITEIFGGRAAKPYRYMSGGSPFNADLFGAEHLMIEDECGSTDLRFRREFGAKIKDFTVNEVQSCHAKNRQALSLRPFWRVSISLNDEAENLMVLPPIDESLTDKIILLRANRHEMPMDTATAEGRAQFWQALMDELPAFIGYLTQWQIPEHLRCPRFGIASWHHPDLLDAIDQLSPELRLLALIDATLFADAGPIVGCHTVTAEDLERKLGASSLGYEARKLLSWANACGTYLGRLAIKRPDRVEAERTASCRLWKLKPAGKMTP